MGPRVDFFAGDPEVVVRRERARRAGRQSLAAHPRRELCGGAASPEGQRVAAGRRSEAMGCREMPQAAEVILARDEGEGNHRAGAGWGEDVSEEALRESRGQRSADRDTPWQAKATGWSAEHEAKEQGA